MKKMIAALAMLAVLACILSGCGMMIVEDSEPVNIAGADRTLTEVC